MEPEKIVVIIPAHNEERTIGPLVESLQRIKSDGIIHNIVVVDDGSTDKTAKFAKENQAKVLSLKKNSGKAFAFYKGAQEARKQGATILVMLDADLKPIHNKEKIENLLRPVVNKQVPMAIGQVHGDSITFSGQRAIRMSALEPLFRGNQKWETYFGIKKGRFNSRAGYALELALNKLLWPKNKKLWQITAHFSALETSRDLCGKTSADTMRAEEGYVGRINHARDSLAKRVRLTRQKRPRQARQMLTKHRQRRA